VHIIQHACLLLIIKIPTQTIHIYLLCEELNTDYADLRRFTRILSCLSNFRGFRTSEFSHERIRVIRENPLNPCFMFLKICFWCVTANGKVFVGGGLVRPDMRTFIILERANSVRTCGGRDG